MGSDPRILITGARGQVGTALAALFPNATALSHGELDVTDAAAVKHQVERADVVVHLAAMTNVDGCELRPDVAYAVNVVGTKNVVENANGAHVVYVSTDYVFDGRKASEYVESDEPNPINVYGRTKLEGERLVRQLDAATVVRTSWVFGRGRNFVATILKVATGDRVEVVDDQRGRPTFAGDVAAALAYIVRASIRGTIHVAGWGPPCTWADLAEQAIHIAGLRCHVERLDTPTYCRRVAKPLAPRPRDSTLALGWAVELGVPLRDWRKSLELYVGQLRASR